jgi:hypothetical protein
MKILGQMLAQVAAWLPRGRAGRSTSGEPEQADQLEGAEVRAF